MYVSNTTERIIASTYPKWSNEDACFLWFVRDRI